MKQNAPGSYSELCHGNLTQEHMLMEASIQGINDAYIVIVGISIVGLLLCFISNTVKQC
ncbi:hypothetical protein MHH52_06760 [Paenibacillus sp. FSL K6-0276]|uniref:hypothetical protein n=1 Tax=Paenibacillus sp. FSL K6-0276 TaxID=2921450 RepID=UPI0030EF3F6E